MKYIIVGLGNFGSSLARTLTSAGHEVIGVDSSMSRVEFYKEEISHTICMDATDEHSVTGLPVADTDIVVVAIGENQGANVMATALFKMQGAKRLVSRSISPIHEKVLQAIGVDDLIQPERETAKRWARRLAQRYFVDSFEINKEYSVVEVTASAAIIGKTVAQLNLQETFHIKLLSTMTYQQYQDSLGQTQLKSHIKGLAYEEQIINRDDILVVYGSNENINKFMRHIGMVTEY